MKGAKGYDLAIVEIGGTVGDIESQPFLEAIRQLKIELEIKELFSPSYLVPFLSTSGETKTKPTQHSVKNLLSYGLQPDILICRSEKELQSSDKRKIALLQMLAWTLFSHFQTFLQFMLFQSFYLKKSLMKLLQEKWVLNLKKRT